MNNPEAIIAKLDEMKKARDAVARTSLTLVQRVCAFDDKLDYVLRIALETLKRCRPSPGISCACIEWDELDKGFQAIAEKLEVTPVYRPCRTTFNPQMEDK